MASRLRSAIRGFRSLREVDAPPWTVGQVNVLLGANGAGKSNVLSCFRMLNSLTEQRLGEFVGRMGGGGQVLHGGPKRSPVLSMELVFDSDAGENRYGFTLAHTGDDRMVFTDERCVFLSSGAAQAQAISLGAGHFESRLREAGYGGDGEARTARFIRQTLLSWRYTAPRATHRSCSRRNRRCCSTASLGPKT